ncbi:MAG: radical SAM protein [Candidatus Gracilibacteria bacterium]|nr:radical SAM protein [Candidatus Gracilibacteria bacterium]
MNTKKTKLELIGRPNFFVDIACDDEIINLNNIFREFIFDANRSSKIIDINKIDSDERNDLLYILSRLQLAFLLFKKLKYKDIGISNLLFSFNIIISYLKILNKFTGGVKLDFYDSIKLSDSIYENIEHNVFYKFFLQQNIFFESLLDGDILDINIKYSNQIFQVYIINYIIKNIYNKNIKVNLFLGGLYEFEDKKSINQIIADKIDNINNIDYKDSFSLTDKIIFGKKYKNFTFFNAGCSWRKCTFCNIGKHPDFILKTEEEKKNQVYKIINQIKEEKIDCISIFDPSITLNDLLLLSNIIIQEGLDIKIHVRTRFTHELTLDVCEKLRKAGVKYLGIGLESSSTRLNKLMNKYDNNYTEEDFGKLVNYTNITGINLHYYTIFGFPTETKDEIISTKTFLLNNLSNHSFFSFTSGLFGLYIGTYVYKNHKKYGIKLLNNFNTSACIDNYYEKQFLENRQLIKSTVIELNNKLFLNLNLDTSFDFKKFFIFLEHSSIFHIQKMYFSKNPYYNFLEGNKNLSIDNFYSLFYKKNEYIHIKKEVDKIILKNWLLGNICVISTNNYNFFISYDLNLSFRDNCNNFFGESLSDREKIELFVLVKNYFFILL